MVSMEKPSIFRRILSSDETEETSALPDFITFDSENRKFSVSPTSTYLNYRYVIRVYCSNTKLTTYDSFSFTLGMSVQYAFTLFLTVLGGVGSALGFLAYRKTFYSMLGKGYYCYSQFERTNVGENYEKIIYLIKDDVRMCQNIWKQMKKKHKDVSAIYDAEDPAQELFDAINEAALALVVQGKIESLANLESYRINQIFQSFLTLEMIHKHPAAEKVFLAMKKKLSAKKHKMWYKDLIRVEPPNLEMDPIKPFPKIEIIQEVFKKAVDEAHKWGNKRFRKLSERERELIEERIKTYALGIPSPATKHDAFMEFSRGESMMINWNEIAEIQIVKTNSSSVHSGIFDFPTRNNFNSLTTWFTYKIEKDMLIFTGTPTKADIGKLVIRIFNGDSLVVREFGVEIYTDQEIKKSRSGRSFMNLMTPKQKKNPVLFTSPNKSPKSVGDERQNLNDLHSLIHQSHQPSDLAFQPSGQAFQPSGLATPMNDIEENIDVKINIT